MGLQNCATQRSVQRLDPMPALRGVLAHLSGEPPPGLGATPQDEVYRRGKLRLRRVSSSASAAAPTSVPLLLIPPLMVRPYIYDLSPTHSMVATLREAGFDTFVTDFGVPDRGDEQLRLDDYVLDFVPTCIEQTLQASGARELAVVGYCMGGLFGLIHAATFRDERVRALVTIGAPVNFSKMGLMTLGARLLAPMIDPVVDLIGNVPGSLSSITFKLITGRKTVLNYLNLLAHLHDEDYVASFRAINFWINDLIPYPKEAFRQMFTEVMAGNKLMRNLLTFGERLCDLREVSCPLLAFAGEQDNVVPPRAVREVVDLVGSRDKRFVTAPGGHVGVVAGSAAPQRTWQPLMAWLRERGSLITSG